MKIGLLCCFYGCHKYLERVMGPWWALNSEQLDVEIAIVHGQFKEYHELGYEDNDSETIKLIESWTEHNKKYIDFLYVQSAYRDLKQKHYQSEAEIRNHRLQ